MTELYHKPPLDHHAVRAKCAGCGEPIYDGQRIFVMRSSYYDDGELFHEDLCYVWCKHCAPSDDSEHCKAFAKVELAKAPE